MKRDMFERTGQREPHEIDSCGEADVVVSTNHEVHNRLTRDFVAGRERTTRNVE